MAIINFFRKPAKHSAEQIAQNIDDNINKHFAEVNERLRRIENLQKETSFQIEEIDNSLQSGDDETVFISALIALADIIEDFYCYAAGDKESSNQGLSNQSSALFEQAQMMWNMTRNKVETAGLTIIDPVDEPFDFNFHSIECTAWNVNLPEEYVIKTLKCGYIFNDEVIRRAAVIVNKQEIGNQEVIYL